MSGIGGDASLRALFADEAAQRLGELEGGLLQLEQGDDGEILTALFREAHTLKGAAAVVGLEEIRLVCHEMESVLERMREGELLATPEVIDALLQTVDGIRSMLPAVLDGTDRSDDAALLVEALRHVEGGGPATSIQGATSAQEVAPAMDGSVTGKWSAPSPRVPQVVAEESVRVPLSRLDELVRLVGESAAANLRVGRLVGERLGDDPGSIDELRVLSQTIHELLDRSLRTRMVPISTVTESLHRAVRDAARITGKPVHWETRGAETELDRRVLQQLADPLLHLVRNAVDHGIESPNARADSGKPQEGVVRLTADRIGSDVVLTISDDGHGIDVARVREEAELRGEDTSRLSDEDMMFLLFRSGLSTASTVSELSGRGVGLDVVRERVEAARGRIEVHSEPGRGTSFRLIVPMTMAVLHCMIVDVGGRQLALPLHAIDVAVERPERSHIHDKPSVLIDDTWLPLLSLGQVFGADQSSNGPVLVVSGPTRRHAFAVDRLVDQRDVVVKALSPLLPDIDLVAGVSIEHDGSLLLVIDPVRLIDRARQIGEGKTPPDHNHGQEAQPTRARARLLVVEDSLVVRRLEQSILERAGYEVVTAVDGADALEQLDRGDFDLVLTDIEMPRVDGFALTAAVRAHDRHANLPVVVLTALGSEADHQRGLEAGADGWMLKTAFDQTSLLHAVERLLGR